MSEIKGSKLTSKLEFARHLAGDGGVEQVLEAMAPADRELVRTAADIRWYPSELYDRLVETICRVLARGDESVYDRMGAYSAEHQLSNVYAAFRKDDLLKTIRNMVPMHTHMNRPGKMEVTVPHADEWVITVTEPKSSLVACRIARAFYRRAAQLAGVDDVEVTETTCTARGADACRFRVLWKHAA